jgi:competence protein ComEC
VHFREIPFLRLFAPLCAGVIVAEYFRIPAAVSWILMAAAMAAMSLRVRRKSYFTDIIFGTALTVFITCCGCLLRQSEKERLSDLDEGRRQILVRISEYPEKVRNGCSFTAKIIAVTQKGISSSPRGSLLLYFMADTLPSFWQPGDMLLVSTSPRPVMNNGNPCEFNYRRYMEGQGIRYMCFFRPRDIIGYHPAVHLSLRERSLVTAHRMVRAFEAAGLHGDELALVTAFTIGNKDMLDRERLTSFSRSGTMHIMAVSGLHVGMISLGLSLMLFFLKGRLRVAKTLIIVTALWAFAFITGMTPSVLRATIMFTFLEAGTLMHRPASGMNNLLASAFILTAFRPSVIFEAGFQLSYLAVAFIIAFYYPLYRTIRIKNRIADYLWQMIAVSLVAQAGTLALTIRLFNIFPLLFLVSNIIVIPVSFAVLVLAFLLIIFSPVPPVSGFIAMLLGKISGAILQFTSMISSVPHGVIENIGMTSPETVLLTVTLALLLTVLLKVRKITLKPFLIGASLFILCGIIINVSESRKDTVIVYNIKGREMKVRQYGRRLFVTPGNGTVPAEIRKHAATRRLKIEVTEPG